MAWESLPPEIQTITRSPASIMLKSAMALPVCRRSRFRNLLNSSRPLRVSLRSGACVSGLSGCDVMLSAMSNR